MHTAAAAALAATAVAGSAETGDDLLHLANAGFLLRAADGSVLIDALFGEGLSGYPAVPGEVRAALERGEAPWSGVRLVLVTHDHADHFDPKAVARFLAASPTAELMAPPQVVEAVRARAGGGSLAGRCHAVLPEPGRVERRQFGRIAVEALNLHHGSGVDSQNLGFVVRLGGRRFLHVGDTEAERRDLEPYLEHLAGADAALLPFWWLIDAERAELVRREIRPGRIVVAHVPSPDAPAAYFGRWGTRDALVAEIRGRFPEATVPAAVAPSP